MDRVQINCPATIGNKGGMVYTVDHHPRLISYGVNKARRIKYAV